MSSVTFEIIKSIGIISTSPTGWTKELNLISWNGRETKYDLREWSPDHTRMGKGITLSQTELDKLLTLLKQSETTASE